MSKKLDKEFKEEFDNELREATYATRKIGTKILIGIVVLVILGGIGGVGYTLTIGKWQKKAEREVFNKLEELVNTLHRVEWRAVGGNPACRGYDSFIKKHNGNKHILKDCIKDRNGNYHDDIIYEIVNE